MPHRLSAILLIGTVLACLAGCGADPAATSGNAVPLEIPRGFVSRLELFHEGRLYRFGPFVGYYFRPVEPDDLRRLRFVTFNEKAFYTRDLPVNAPLFEGEARFATLPSAGRTPPPADDPQRMTPVFFEDAPQSWLDSRPKPREAYRHFHSCYDAGGAVRHGFWLRHTGVAVFTYDMGGRVGTGSPLHHEVEKGVDLDFARIVEFDRGPR